MPYVKYPEGTLPRQAAELHNAVRKMVRIIRQHLPAAVRPFVPIPGRAAVSFWIPECRPCALKDKEIAARRADHNEWGY